MRFSKEIFESVISEFKAEGERLRSSKKHVDDGCEACRFMSMFKEDLPLAKLYTEYLGQILLAINPVQALLEPEEMFAIVSGVFMIGMKVGRLQILHEQQNFEQQVKQ